MGPLNSGSPRRPRSIRPFPAITPQSYVQGTGGGGYFPNMLPPGKYHHFSIITTNSYPS